MGIGEEIGMGKTGVAIVGCVESGVVKEGVRPVISDEQTKIWHGEGIRRESSFARLLPERLGELGFSVCNAGRRCFTPGLTPAYPCSPALR